MISATYDSPWFAKTPEDQIPWAEITRAQHDRRSLRYASDCTDEEWSLIAPFMPPPAKVGRPRGTDLRKVWNAIQYIASTGCQWAQLPKEFPPFTTVQYYFYQLRDSGAFEAINETLVMAARLLAGRKAEPTAGVIDSQSVKSTESRGVCGYHAGKKSKGRKRHIVTDTEGHRLAGLVHPATFRIVTAPSASSQICAPVFRQSLACSPMAPMQATSWSSPC